MVAVATDILHEQNFDATQQLEVMIGHDKIVRVNIDGICALRVRLPKDMKVLVQDDGGLVVMTGRLWRGYPDPDDHE